MIYPAKSKGSSAVAHYGLGSTDPGPKLSGSVSRKVRFVARGEKHGRMLKVQHDTVDKHQASVEDVKEGFMLPKVRCLTLPDLDAPVHVPDQLERGAGV